MLIRTFMERIKELHYMKTTLIHVEMNISGFKVWGKRFPYLYFRVKFLYFTPGTISYSLAMHIG